MLDPGFTVREATEGDLEAVVRLAEVQQAAHWDRGAFQSYLEEDDGGFLHRVLLVAVSAEGLIGFAVASWLSGDSGGELLNLAVAKAARRRGVARLLCSAVAEWLRELGVAELELEVRASNAAAIALYGALGFVEFGRRAKYYQQPEEDALLMRWKIAGQSSAFTSSPPN